MEFLKKIINAVSPQLDAKQSDDFQQQAKAFVENLDGLGGKYITFSDTEIFKGHWKEQREKCRTTRIPKKDPAYPAVKEFTQKFDDLENIIAQKNDAFIKEESYRFDALLSDIDGKSLDAQQREAVLSDECRNLVLAGAGSGKTLTIAGKVKYLCKVKNVSPEDILLIAFTKKSAEEMTTRITDRLGIPVTATTFHKLGLDIITQALGKSPDVCDDLTDFVRSYFENALMKDNTQIKNIIEYRQEVFQFL